MQSAAARRRYNQSVKTFTRKKLQKLVSSTYSMFYTMMSSAQTTFKKPVATNKKIAKVESNFGSSKVGFLNSFVANAFVFPFQNTNNAH
jgi:hypothetical protein